MLKEDPQIDISDGLGNKPIHYAAIASTSNVTRYLLDCGVNPLSPNTNVG